MFPIRLLRTANFRLAAVYALIFGVSVMVLASVIYWRSTSELEAQARLRMQTEASALRTEYLQGGLKQLISAITGRQRGHVAGGLDYTVHDGRQTRYFGSLKELPHRSGWSTVTGPPDGDEPAGQLEQLDVYTVPLSKSLWLSVGDDFGRIGVFGAVILETFVWALVLTITLAIVGGLVLSAGFLGRVEAITDTAKAIINGDIQRRIPRRGSKDELDDLADTLNQMLDRIGGLMEALRQVTNDIAHDLRMPLSTLRQTLESARERARSVPEFDHEVGRAVEDVDAILETFSALLRIAQIEAGSRRARFRDINLSDLVDNLMQTYAVVADDAGKSVRVTVPRGIHVKGDGDLLIQMIANVIENAIRHTPERTNIEVTLTKSPSPVLTVADGGPGIPASERDRVFQRFHRLDRSRTTPGNGLGLSIVAAIAELHDIKISLDDNKPGLRVAMSFPGQSANQISQSPRARATMPA
ncbi:MAG: HAMP domain-containing protein [Alphaproteobacteria bacterium]|nr:HAMP domain-containing protein [Alphaproteobacteria bacterium]